MEPTEPGPPPEFTPLAGGWKNEDQARAYAQRMGRLSPRLAGEGALEEFLPPNPRSVLDLGCGDGRLVELVLKSRPSTERAIGIDNSPAMLAMAAERCGDDGRTNFLEADLRDDITGLGTFDVIVSGFAIHHLEDHRKRRLFAEISTALAPEGVFLNLEVVRSATPALHAQFLTAIGRTADDPEDRLASVHDQLQWMREAPLVEVDCHWRWRGFALLGGKAPVGGP